ncbi:hypothetical protein XI09_19315 [Bradyrhizobium sp. CCBAU 11386]|nr:hypothetical protein [Bradyrhizobium sp. CCBAU 11386]
MRIQSEQAKKATRPLHLACCITAPDTCSQLFFNQTKHIGQTQMCLQLKQISPRSEIQTFNSQLQNNSIVMLE